MFCNAASNIPQIFVGEKKKAEEGKDPGTCFR